MPLCSPAIYVSAALVSVRTKTIKKSKFSDIFFITLSGSYSCPHAKEALTIPLSTTSWSSVKTMMILDGAPLTLNCKIIDDQLKIQITAKIIDELHGFGNILSEN